MFKGFTGQMFGLEGIVLEAPMEDVWMVFANSDSTSGFDEQIESVECLCK